MAQSLGAKMLKLTKTKFFFFKNAPSDPPHVLWLLQFSCSTLASSFIPLDLLYFKSVAILSHDNSNSLTPTNISNLLPNLIFIHIIQDHLQEVTIMLNTERDKQTKSFSGCGKNLE